MRLRLEWMRSTRNSRQSWSPTLRQLSGRRTRDSGGSVPTQDQSAMTAWNTTTRMRLRAAWVRRPTWFTIMLIIDLTTSFNWPCENSQKAYIYCIRDTICVAQFPRRTTH